MRGLVVNCSRPHYNLGAAKVTNWLREQGYEVDYDTGGPGLFAPTFDLVALSVVEALNVQGRFRSLDK